jgi:GT2 family glycosyltransferase
MHSMPPAVSVVVATYGRRHLLQRLVTALEAQRVDGGHEAVIVDDGSADDTPGELRRLAAHARIPLEPIVLDRNRGPAAARNVGWRAARGNLVVFTDDDCVPQPGWLAAIAGAVSAGADLVQGRTLPDPAQAAGRGPFSRSMEVTFEDGLYQTCNAAYRRSLLEQLGGFDERFRFPYGEDVDLGWRARETGASTVFCAEALVLHDVVDPGFLRHLRDLRRREGVALVLRMHPRLRPYLWRGLFFDASHPPAVLAATGLAIAAWRRSPRATVLGGALCGPWLWHRGHRRPLPGRRGRRPDTLVLALAADLVESVVLAAASARYRTLVL